MKRLAAAAFLAGIAALPPCAIAAIYEFIDHDGVLNLSDRMEGAEYRMLPGYGAIEEPRRTSPTPAALVDQIAFRHGLEPALVHAIVAVESAYRPQAVSAKGARGLMQLMPETARRYGVRDPHDPAENLEGGIRYLKDLLAMFHQDQQLAVAAYNAGENAVLRAGYRVPGYRETRAYVGAVLARLRVPTEAAPLPRRRRMDSRP